MPSEQVVGMARNGWTASIGIDGRHGPDYAHSARLPPDYLLELIDGVKKLHEAKGSQFINNPNTIRKYKGARN